MPRYFFHIRDRDRLIEDEEGLDLAGSEHVVREAQSSARDMLRDALLTGDNIGDQVIEVTDSSGAVVHVVHLSIEIRDFSKRNGRRP